MTETKVETKAEPVSSKTPKGLEMLRAGEYLEFDNSVARIEEPPAGKKAKRVYLRDDDTMYWTFHKMTDIKKSDVLHVKVFARALDNGTVTYELESYSKII